MTRAVAVLTIALFLLAGGACGSSGGDETLNVGGQEVSKARLRDAAEALCTARDQAARDVMTARATFYDRSHDDLHTIARALDSVDRALAARLLEAKQKVEADLASGADPSNPVSDLSRLADVTGEALERLNIAIAACR